MQSYELYDASHVFCKQLILDTWSEALLPLLSFFFNIYLFIWLPWVLVVVFGTFSCGMLTL